MATFDILLFLLLGGIVFGAITGITNYLIGGYRLLSWMKRQRDSLRKRGSTATSVNEQRAISEILMACDQLQKIDLRKWKFKFETISMIEKISSIYHPNSTVPIEQARLGDILEVLQEANQKILHIIHLPRINYITGFRLINFLESFITSPVEKNNVKKNTSEIKNQKRQDILFGPDVLIDIIQKEEKLQLSLIINWQRNMD